MSFIVDFDICVDIRVHILKKTDTVEVISVECAVMVRLGGGDSDVSHDETKDFAMKDVGVVTDLSSKVPRGDREHRPIRCPCIFVFLECGGWKVHHMR